MQLVKIVAVAGKFPSREWKSFLEEIKSYCADQQILIIRQRSDDHGDDRYTEFVIEINMAKKVRKFINERLLNKI